MYQTTIPSRSRSRSSGSSRSRSRNCRLHRRRRFSPYGCSMLLFSSSSSSWDEDDYEDDQDHDQQENPMMYYRNINFDQTTGRYKLTNSFEELLQQCTVQSLLYLMVSALHDRHTALWLEEFTSPVIHKKPQYYSNKDDQELETMASAYDEVMKKEDYEPSTTNLDTKEIKLLNYHGVGAMNTTRFPTWYSYYEKLLKEDVVTYEITTRRTNYDLVIDPLSLSRRLLSVRSQIANEFTQDLDLIAEMSIQQCKQLLEENYDNGSNNKPAKSLERFNVLSLQQVVDDNSMKPSPLRLGNYDLLLSLTTQEAIHRILNNSDDNDADADEENVDKIDKAEEEVAVRLDTSMVEYLATFYNERLVSHFTGSSSRYNRATDFLDELLMSSSSISSLVDDTIIVSFDDQTISNIRPSSRTTGAASTATIVAAILKSREMVANEWIDITLDVPDQHMEIQKLQLDRQMKPPPPSPPSTTPARAITNNSNSNINSSWESYYGGSTSNKNSGEGSSTSQLSNENDFDDDSSSSSVAQNGDDCFQ